MGIHLSAEADNVERSARYAVVVLLALLASTLLSGPSSAASPAGPRLLTPTDRTVLNHPDFRWTAVTGAAEYTIEIAQDRRFTTKRFTFTTSATRFLPTHSLPAAAFWWRVRVSAPFTSKWSSRRQFTRRWLAADATTGKQEVARPDAVTVEDFSTAPGLQAPMNALQISWEPVTDASYYVVQFDFAGDADPDQVPPFGTEPDAVCITPHTVLTPNVSPATLPENGAALITDPEAQGCTVATPGTWFVRVRAVDQTSNELELYSLWSDEARSPGAAAPGTTAFLLANRLPEDPTFTPAVLTSPANGARFTDSPVMAWNPKSAGASDLCGSTDPCYKVVVALDTDFTTEVGHFYTTNTRFMPLERIPEENAEQSFYWYVVPCGPKGCVSANQVVNRPSVYRTFTKLSPRPETRAADRVSGPFAMFGWTSAAHTATRMGHARDSVAGTDYYEFQTRLPGRPWSEVTVVTDVPEYLPSDLLFNTRYQWRVRVVDGSDQIRPWSTARSVRTPAAAPGRPQDLRARRAAGKVTLTWRASAAGYFPVERYTIFYSLNGKRWKPLGSTGGRKAVYRVKQGVRYWFMVTAVSRGGTSLPSRVVVGK